VSPFLGATVNPVAYAIFEFEKSAIFKLVPLLCDDSQMIFLSLQKLSLDEERPESINQKNTIDVGILNKEEENLKSLEFCFLNDLISAEDNNQMHLFELDFELVATPLEDLEDKQEINEIHKKEENRKEEKVLSSLIENIISFPKKFKEKFNG
jgi:hypothetical protein